MFTNLTIKRSNYGGYTLIEGLVYISVLALLLGAIISSLVVILGLVSQFQTARNINTSALTALERLNREIKNSDSIDLVASTFNTHPGRLVIAAEDETFDFFLSDNRLMLAINDDPAVALTPANITVTNLIFNYFSTEQSAGIKVTVTMADNRRPNQTDSFYLSAVSRGSY